jgi:DNA-binding response OmpR family regulator
VSRQLNGSLENADMPSRILVVDDDEGYLAGMKELLELHGHEPLLARTFEEGQRALRDRAPDILIADVRLGPFNGLQLIAMGQIRIPTIVVSGFDDPVLQADARAFGADYLVKPVATATLLGLIDQKLAMRGVPLLASSAPLLEVSDDLGKNANSH